jgi:hypothetical protein
MAKNKTIDAAINDLLKDYEKVLKKATKYATYKAKQDIYNYAYNCLEAYYDSYIPNIYERTYSLINAFVPFSTMNQKEDKITIKAGVEYDPFRLEPYYAGTGSSHYDPDPWWILNNYLDGIHPATNGKSDEALCEYYEILRLPSPTEKMEKYLDSYAETFNKNLLISFAKQMK